MVEAEQVGQFLGVLGAPLHGVEQGQLAVQQHLVAARQVDEDLGDAPAQFGLLDGGFDGGALEAVEGEGDLADLVLLEFQPGRLGLHVDVLAAWRGGASRWAAGRRTPRGRPCGAGTGRG